MNINDEAHAGFAYFDEQLVAVIGFESILAACHNCCAGAGATCFFLVTNTKVNMSHE